MYLCLVQPSSNRREEAQTPLIFDLQCLMMDGDASQGGEPARFRFECTQALLSRPHLVKAYSRAQKCCSAKPIDYRAYPSFLDSIDSFALSDADAHP